MLSQEKNNKVLGMFTRKRVYKFRIRSKLLSHLYFTSQRSQYENIIQVHMFGKYMKELKHLYIKLIWLN